MLAYNFLLLLAKANIEVNALLLTSDEDASGASSDILLWWANSFKRWLLSKLS